MKEESADHLSRALRTIETAEKIFRDGDYNSVANRIYYAMFYTAKALLIQKDLRRFSKHRAVQSAFGEYFSKTNTLDSKYHRWLIDAFDKRLQGDYGDYSVTSDSVPLMLQQAREFLEAARLYLSQIK